MVSALDMVVRTNLVTLEDVMFGLILIGCYFVGVITGTLTLLIVAAINRDNLAQLAREADNGTLRRALADRMFF